MTRVSFYILEDAAPEACMRFACRLAEKVHDDGRRLYVHVDDTAAGKQLDEMLWTFRQGSFVPHARVPALTGDDDPTPVVIGSGDPPPGFDDVLINLGTEVPGCFSRFQRAVEIVNPATRQAARQRYKFYQDRGYELETHKIA